MNASSSSHIQLPEQSGLENSTMGIHQLTPAASGTAAIPNRQIIERSMTNSENDVKPVGEEDDLGHDDHEDSEYKNLATPLFDFITRRVADLSTENHAEHTDFSEFKAFWRDKFEIMRLELGHSRESELFITDPPLKELEIEILNDADERECPCCNDFVNAQIVIWVEGGITRDHFLKALKDGLYGEDVRSKHLRLSDRHQGTLVLKDWDYMETEGDVLYKGFGYERMRIWVYCSDKLIRHDPRETKL